MKTPKDKLSQRGFLPQIEEESHLILPEIQLLALLQSATPTKRTLAARSMGLSQEKGFIAPLIQSLKIEKKLYTKLEICNSLASFKIHSVLPLIEVLGTIGTNQYKSVPEEEFKKKNYPLPRDIAARTLIRIGTIALPSLTQILTKQDTKQLSEAIDAIGYINFYNPSPSLLVALVDCLANHFSNHLIKWKLVRAFSGYPMSKTNLLELRKTEVDSSLRQEINRSLTLIDQRNSS